MLQLRPSTFDPSNVWLIIGSSFVEVNSFREAFPEAGILDGHLDRGGLAVKATSCWKVCRFAWLKRGSGTRRLLLGADFTRIRRCKYWSRSCVREPVMPLRP